MRPIASSNEQQPCNAGRARYGAAHASSEEKGRHDGVREVGEEEPERLAEKTWRFTDDEIFSRGRHSRVVKWISLHSTCYEATKNKEMWIERSHKSCRRLLIYRRIVSLDITPKEINSLLDMTHKQEMDRDGLREATKICKRISDKS
ncbi:unnamed protein product [Microthlaspi erraticum]|uniref:Uncharacterized protein n=1 Tax=Microthlaspi erraticum TaxID=1685480 RepID=A0A6D2JKG3_9BRAS|nr:unnamed protein product [Microthlaspi erraticum]